MRPITTYTENLAGATCSFELLPDRIWLRESGWLGWRSEYSIPLVGIDPYFVRTWERSARFGGGIFLIVLFAVLDAILWRALWPSYVYYLFWLNVPVVAGIALVVSALRPMEKTLFRLSCGYRTFAIHRSGPETDRYAAFVSAVVAAIEASRAREQASTNAAIGTGHNR